MSMHRLFSRAVIRLAPLDPAENVVDFLQGLVTNDVAGALPVWAGLLTPQGKALFDFIVWPGDGGLLIDCEAAAADALVKRLSIYRLRRRIAITRDADLGVSWSTDAVEGAAPDPRLPALGWRRIARVQETDEAADSAWLAHRLANGVAEGRTELGDANTLWLECNAAELAGVSFAKGCYVGQENTARMNWRQKVNRRLIVVPADQSQPARTRAVYPELGQAVDHLRLDDIRSEWMPAWLPATDGSEE